MEAINKAIFPGTSGGPHLDQIAAYGQALLEILGEDSYPDGVDFKTYSQNVLDTTKSLEQGAEGGGLEVISPTQNHLCLVKFPDDVDSLDAQKKLESLGIITNRNVIPFDAKSPFRPSGMRLGTAALASRGLTVPQARELGELLAKIVLGTIEDDDAKKQEAELVSTLKWYYPAP